MSGTVDLGSGSRKGKEGWRLVLPRKHLPPIVEHNDDLRRAPAPSRRRGRRSQLARAVRDLAGTRPE